MNCQDIAAILNERDIETLSAAEQRTADRHLEDCHQCAREWATHERLIASPVPPMPGRLGQRLHEIALSAARPGRPRRAGGRPMLVAGLMLLGAAAAALVGASTGPTSSTFSSAAFSPTRRKAQTRSTGDRAAT